MTYKLSLFGDYDCVSSDSSEGGHGASSHLEGRGSPNSSPASSRIVGLEDASSNAPFKFNIPVNGDCSDTSDGKQSKGLQQQDIKHIFFNPFGIPLRKKPVEPTKKVKIAIARYAAAEMKKARKSFMVADACKKLDFKHGDVSSGEPMALLQFYDFMIRENWMRWPEAHLNANEDKFPGLAARIRRAVKMDHDYVPPKNNNSSSGSTLSPSKKDKSDDSSGKLDGPNRDNEVSLLLSRKETAAQTPMLPGERKNKDRKVKSEPEKSLIKKNPEQDLSMLKSTIEALEEKKNNQDLKDTLIKCGLMKDSSVTKYVPKTRSPRQKPKSKRRVKSTDTPEESSGFKLVMLPLELTDNNMTKYYLVERLSS